MPNSLTPIAIEEFIMMACSCIATIIGYLNKKKFYSIRLFYIYPLASLIQMIIYKAIYYSSFSDAIFDQVKNSTTNFFLIIEIIMMYYFFYAVMNSHKIKKVLTTILILYSLFVFFLWFKKGLLFNQPILLFIYQAVTILIPCIIYFLELLKTPASIKFSDPHFWIALGIMFYFGGTLPLFLLGNFIFDLKGYMLSNLYAINYACYSIFFLLIARAYLCPPNPINY